MCTYVRIYFWLSFGANWKTSSDNLNHAAVEWGVDVWVVWEVWCVRDGCVRWCVRGGCEWWMWRVDVWEMDLWGWMWGVDVWGGCVRGGCEWWMWEVDVWEVDVMGGCEGWMCEGWMCEGWTVMEMTHGVQRCILCRICQLSTLSVFCIFTFIQLFSPCRVRLVQQVHQVYKESQERMYVSFASDMKSLSQM